MTQIKSSSIIINYLYLSALSIVDCLLAVRTLNPLLETKIKN